MKIRSVVDAEKLGVRVSNNLIAYFQVKRVILLVILTMVFLQGLPYPLHIEQVRGASGSYSENFTTTTNMDPSYTNVTGWGSGNISLPQKTLTLAGSYDTPGIAGYVIVAGDYAYIADRTGGLRVINITDPTSPAEVGSYNTPGEAIALAVTGDYAYIADGASGLHVVNITNPTSPTFLGSYNTPGQANAIDVAGDYAYIADRTGGLRVINITDPTNPAEVGFYDTPGYAYGVEVAGDYAYVADDGEGLRVINITDPINPAEVSYYSTSELARGIALAGDYAYIACNLAGLLVINITYPTNPTLVGSYDTSGAAQEVRTAGDYAYIADYTSGMQIVNITNPSNPTWVGVFDTVNESLDVFIEGNYAYIADTYSGLQIVQISDHLTPPVYTGRYYVAGPSGNFEMSQDVAIAGDYAYVANWQNGFAVVNISDPTSPDNVSYVDTPHLALGIDVAGDYVYIADGSSGLQVYNVSNPLNPTFAGSCNPGYGMKVVVEGDYAYFISQLEGLRVVDVSNPNTPTVVAYYSIPQIVLDDKCWDVFIDGDYAYVAARANGLQVVDIRDPLNPTNASAFSTPGQAYAIFVEGDYGYVADKAGLSILNLSNPRNPSLIIGYNIPGDAGSIYVDGNYAYLGDINQHRFYVFDISNPTNPVLVSNISHWNPLRIVVEGEYAYISSNDGGVYIYEVKRNRVRQFKTLAVAQSTTIFTDLSSASIVNATLNSVDSIPSGTSIAYYLSADNGIAWELVTPGVEHSFTNTGYQLKWKANLSSINTLLTPIVSNLSITYNSKLSAPSLINPLDGQIINYNTPPFGWGTVNGAVNYLLQVDNESNFNFPYYINVTVSSTSYTHGTALSDGTWYWRVMSIDSQGDVGVYSQSNSLIIDTISPVVTITSPTSIMYGQDSVTLEYTVSEGTTTIYVDGTANTTALPSSSVISSLSEGSHNITIVAADLAANIGQNTVIFSVDTTNPIITITSPTNIVYGQDSVTLEYTISEGTTTIYIDDTANTTALPSGSVISNLSEGSHNITIVAADLAANIGQNTVIFSVDTTNPIITITSPTNIVYGQDSVTLEYTVSEGTTTIYIDDTANTTALPSGSVISNLSEGSHNITIVAADLAANIGQNTVIFSVDTTNPIITITSPTNIVYGQDSVTLEYTISEGTTTIYIDGTANTTALPSSSVISSLSEGSHNITIVAADLAANIGQNTVIFSVDTTNPIITITSPTNIVYGQDSVTLEYTVSEGTTTIYIDGTANTTALPSSSVISSLSEGSHNISIVVVDLVGNIGRNMVIFTVDLTNPVVNIVNPTNKTYGQKNVTLEYTVSEGTTTIYVDGTANTTALPSSSVISNLSEGSHNITIVVVDLAANIGQSTVIFSVDTTNPIITITSPTNIEYGQDSVTLEYTISEGTTTIYIDDTANTTSLPSGSVLSNLSEGSHNISIVVVDLVGNIGRNMVIFTVDLTNPVVNIVNPTNKTYGQKSVTLEYTISKAAATVYINGIANTTALPSGSVLSNLSEGSYNITIVAVDLAGNVGQSTVIFSVDTTNPIITITSPTNITYGQDYGTDTITVTLSGNAVHYWYYIEAVDSQNQTWTTSVNRTLSDGTYTLHAYGNKSAYNIAYTNVTFRIDSTPPTVEVTYPNGKEIIEGLIRIMWTANDTEGESLTFSVSYWNGYSWISLANNITETNYIWDTTTVIDRPDYKIRVTVSDGFLTGVDESDDIFTIDNDESFQQIPTGYTEFIISDTITVGINVDETVNVTIQTQVSDLPSTPGSLEPLEIYLNITLSDPEALKDLWINISFDELNGRDPNNVKIYYYNEDDERWVEAKRTGVDLDNEVVWAWTDHLTLFGVMNEQTQPADEWLTLLVMAVVLITPVVVVTVFIYRQAKKRMRMKKAKEQIRQSQIDLGILTRDFDKD